MTLKYSSSKSSPDSRFLNVERSSAIPSSRSHATLMRALAGLAAMSLLGGCASVPADAPVALHEAQSELESAMKINTKAVFPKTIKASEIELEDAIAAYKSVPSDERAGTDWASHPSTKEAILVRDRMKKANAIRYEMNDLDGELDAIEGDTSIVSLGAQVSQLKRQMSTVEKENERELSLARESMNARNKPNFAFLNEVPLHGPTLYFDTDKVQISERDLPALKELAQAVSENQSLQLRLVGYADPRGGADYNESLSLRRAEKVREALLNEGLNADQITVQSMGSKTAFFKDGPSKLQLERRVEMLISQK